MNLWSARCVRHRALPVGKGFLVSRECDCGAGSGGMNRRIMTPPPQPLFLFSPQPSPPPPPITLPLQRSQPSFLFIHIQKTLNISVFFFFFPFRHCCSGVEGVKPLYFAHAPPLQEAWGLGGPAPTPPAFTKHLTFVS